MRIHIKSKQDLNKVTHSVRAAQAVLQYGVGAMVDFQDQTLVTAAPEYWTKTNRIYDDRFAKALNVDYFATPENIAYDRFPQWYFCPKCRRFQPLLKWQQEYREKAKDRDLAKDPYMIKHMQCPKCHQDLVVSRIVTVCEKGHLNDFPWVEWVHEKAKKPIGKNFFPTIFLINLHTGRHLWRSHANGTQPLIRILCLPAPCFITPCSL